MKNLILSLLFLSISTTSFSQIYGCDNAGVGDTFHLDFYSGYYAPYYSYDFFSLQDLGSGDFVALTTGPTTIYLSYSTYFYTKTITITPTALIRDIKGRQTVCPGSSFLLTDAMPGGTWSSSNPAVETITSGGRVSALAPGGSIITYSLSGATCTLPLSVASPPTPITGPSSMCAGDTILLSSMTFGGGDVYFGGIYASGDTTIAKNITPYIPEDPGLILGVSSGTVTITFTDIYSPHCAAKKTITVTSAPVVPGITGVTTLCLGSVTTLSDATSGGTWSSVNTTIASIAPSSGLLATISAGIDTINYSVSNSCGTTSSSVQIVIDAAPYVSPISGPDSMCSGASILLSDATSGGVWSSSNTIVAMPGSTGYIAGVSAGTATISYTLTNVCGSTSEVSVVAVNPLPAAISGTDSVCAGSTTLLSDSGGGTWNSSDTAVATVSSGSVAGISAGTATIVYTLSTGCTVTTDVVVNPLPLSITGVHHICPADSTTLTDSGGGLWSSDNLSIATIGSSSGMVTGTSAGTATISYSYATGCAVATVFTVDSTHVPTVTIVNGGDSVCAGSFMFFGAIPVNGGMTPHYQWKVNGVLSGTDTNYYYYMPADSDVVSVMLTSNAICPAPDTATSSVMMRAIAVILPSLSILVSPGVTISKGESDTLTATISGGGITPAYQWLINGIPVPGATNSVFTCDSLADKDSVTCVSADTGACTYATFNSVVINVSTLGLTSLQGQNDLVLFPNPNNGVFRIIGSTIADSEVSLEIRNILGQLVYQRSLGTKNDSIDAQIEIRDQLTDGIYQALLRSGGYVQTIKFVKE